MNDDQIKKMIQEHEGVVDEVYLDSLDNPTCGVGHLLAVGSKVPEKAVQAFFDQDYRVAVADYTALVHQYSLDLGSIRRAVLINMLFNMGINRVRTFKKMFAALVLDNYEWAADEMLDSRWAVQVGKRAVELSRMMRGGGV
ncbi:MAG: glycoside hydrolase [Deltaproteobacteria bacterium]|nr:glycoside hydrolase [Deltaproteobacteria bacterium]